MDAMIDATTPDTDLVFQRPNDLHLEQGKEQIRALRSSAVYLNHCSDWLLQKTS